MDIEFLLDDNMPDIYFDQDYHNLSMGLAHLLFGIRNSNKIRVKTMLERDTQILELAWNGEPLKRELLWLINLQYNRCAKEDTQPTTSDTLIAGYFIGRVKGKVRIENHQDGIYVARNLVELPVDYK